MHTVHTAVPVQNKPLWAAGFQMPVHTPLSECIETEVCIVGAGIAGLSTAYMLLKAGKRVAVLDDGGLCEGMTQSTTAHLSNAIDNRYIEIERLHGENGARLAAHSHTSAINRIEYIVEAEGIDCGFERVDGYLFLGPNQEEDLLDREMHAARRAGLSAVRKLEHVPLESIHGGPCLLFPNQAQFHPLRYLAGVAECIVRDGGLLFTHTHADRIEGGTPVHVFAGRNVVTADSVVVATNSPVNDRFSIHTKQAGYMSYVIGARIPAGSVPNALFWDTAAPYHYVRVEAAPPDEKPPGEENTPEDESGPGSENPPAYDSASTHDILIVGGEDHKVGQAENAQERYSRLESWARIHFPSMENVEFEWAGQVMETVDGLAYIGKNPMDNENVFIVTGDSGMGMTHGTIAGMLLTDMILGRDNPWAVLYDPSRKTASALGRYLKENINTALQFRDWITPAEARSTTEILPDSGAILRDGLTKVAVYRDEAGQLFTCSAVCPHLGGIVRWNSNAKSWDCPCHGSRFDKFGAVIMGPANVPLARLDTAKSEEKSMESRNDTRANCTDQMWNCIENCQETQEAATRCIFHCLEEGGKQAAPDHIRMLMDCAAITRTTVDFMLRGSMNHHFTCGVCGKICERCAEACEALDADSEHLHRCAEACRRSAESCQAMANQHAQEKDQMQSREQAIAG